MYRYRWPLAWDARNRLSDSGSHFRYVTLVLSMSRYQGRERGWEKATLPWPTSSPAWFPAEGHHPGLGLPGEEGLGQKDRHQITGKQGGKGSVRGTPWSLNVLSLREGNPAFQSTVFCGTPSTTFTMWCLRQEIDSQTISSPEEGTFVYLVHCSGPQRRAVQAGVLESSSWTHE